MPVNFVTAVKVKTWIKRRPQQKINIRFFIKKFLKRFVAGKY